MNNHMYEHPATQANLALLAQRGVSVVGPDSGRLASHGEHGVGRLAEPAAILAACEQLLGAGSRAGVGAGAWDGLRVLVSAGGTREPIDAVRFIGNRSSGRMGWAMAEAARARGAQVTLVAANVALPAPPGVDVVTVGSAAELAKACTERFADCHVLLMAAAVAEGSGQQLRDQLQIFQAHDLDRRVHIAVRQTDERAGDAAARPEDDVGVRAAGAGHGLVLERQLLLRRHGFCCG